ncbi:Kae1-associated serine/threonine protein kinase [Candidatus Woesearchaeota archaeon]|nr:Kae1-associated serine/threonine protein kinase [Candidatus Woesearchaeota archaeon]MBW3006388.1 Kae1-associated serine/threonine protein kinase [Candidatus Woesearchaeota archaeon]
MEKIGSGAEAILYKEGNKVLKDRISKDYRQKDLDNSLRKARTRREAKVLTKLKEIGIPGPELLDMDDKSMRISMSFINGDKLRDVLHNNPVELSKEVGRKVAKLHANDIIHADLTTSNMILDKEIHFIDFGLSFFSTKEEDKAVDLHLLDRALESKHHEIYEECIKAVLEGYKEDYPDAEKVLNRLEKVQLRGRNKKKTN